jgi:urease accessory protein
MLPQSPDKLEAYPTWKARLHARFEYVANCTRITDRKHFGPLQIQKALYPEGPSICHATILHPPGGLAQGDELELDFHLGPSAHVVLSTPSATKWYKAPSGSATQRISIKVDAGARLEWLPGESILFNRSRPQMELKITLADGATVLGWEMICLGRRESGESWQEGRLRIFSEFVRSTGELLRVEQATLEAGSSSIGAGQILAGFPTFGTFWALGPACTPAIAESLFCPFDDQIRSGATCLPGNVLLVRAVSRQIASLRDAMVCWRTTLRTILHGVPALPLRLWST